MMYATSLEELEIQMTNTIQTKDISVLEHGYMVNGAYKKLINELEQNQHIESGLYNLIKDKILDTEIIDTYQIYHDCGKPFCRTEEGRFPDHALHSYNQWKLLYPDDEIISNLMLLDMGFHTYRGDELIELCRNPLAPTLYFTAWAELEANAAMFGGHDSDSYKIKKKRLIKAGKNLHKIILNE
jgi:hypothetical protein